MKRNLRSLFFVLATAPLTGLLALQASAGVCTFSGHCGGGEGAIRGMETDGGDHFWMFGHFLA